MCRVLVRVQGLKHVVVSTLTARAKQYEMEVRRRYDKHQVVGWNFCDYFAVKEVRQGPGVAVSHLCSPCCWPTQSLAHMYRQMGLLDETLRQCVVCSGVGCACDLCPQLTMSALPPCCAGMTNLKLPSS